MPYSLATIHLLQTVGQTDGRTTTMTTAQITFIY